MWSVPGVVTPSPPTVHPSVKEMDAAKRSGTPKRAKGKDRDDASGGHVPTGADPRGGRLQPIAAKILMKALYVAWSCRMDLLRAIGHLACVITRWTSECDRKLHRRMCYINSHLRLQMTGWVGDQVSDVQPRLFADADLAGCTDYLAIRGARTCFPISGVSKRQSCVSHSTPEAEMVAIDFSLRHALYGHPQSGSFWEDHCDELVQKARFVSIGPTRPSWYPELGLLLTVYVEDFKNVRAEGQT